MTLIFTPFFNLQKNIFHVTTVLVLCFYSSNSRANHIKTDTIPVPAIITKIKSTIGNILPNSKKNPIVQKDSIEKKIPPKYWTVQNNPSIILTQTSFVNWTKGGSNSIAGIASFRGNYDYKKSRLYWTNHITLKYGLSKENDEDYAQKTDDIIDLKSAVGYKTSKDSKWYYSGEFNLTTQFNNGYKGKDRSTLISTFFAPARMRTGIGAVYTDNDHFFKLHISPLTNQITFVLNQELANKGAFGVQPAVKDDLGNILKKGDNIYSELGALIRVEYKTTLMQNIILNIRSSFYADYLKSFGNVDTDIELNIDMKVNKYIQAKIGSHVLYDDDAKIIEKDGTQKGPRTQLKQILGVGVTYAF